MREKLMYPFYSMVHPIDGFEGIKWSKKGSIGVSILILLCFFLSQILRTVLTGFAFNMTRPERLNILILLCSTVVPFVFWTVANWSLCTLMDGEGKFQHIWIASAYALMPVILSNILMTVASNLITIPEAAFMGMAQTVFSLWGLMLMTMAMMIIHQYTFGKTLLSMFLTVVGMGIIVFLIVLVFSLFQQLSIFIGTIYSEIQYRL